MVAAVSSMGRAGDTGAATLAGGIPAMAASKAAGTQTQAAPTAGREDFERAVSGSKQILAFTAATESMRTGWPFEQLGNCSQSPFHVKGGMLRLAVQYGRIHASRVYSKSEGKTTHLRATTLPTGLSRS